MNRRIELLIMVSVIAILLTSGFLLYFRTMGLQSHLDSVTAEVGMMQNTIQELTQKTEDLSKPQFYTTQLNWSISQESSNRFRIEITGTVFNAGVDGACWVIAEPSFGIFTSGHQFLGGIITPQNFTIWNIFMNGYFEGKTFRTFSQSFQTDNLLVWNITAIGLAYSYSTTSFPP